VIIQPHLRFVYELLKWEEVQRVKRGKPLRREMEWASVAREIAAMNRPYARGWFGGACRNAETGEPNLLWWRWALRHNWHGGM